MGFCARACAHACAPARHQVLDLAQEYLDAQFAAHGEELALARPALEDSARYWCRRWLKVQSERISALRWFCVFDVSFQGTKYKNYFYRFAALAGNALRTSHETVSAFTGPLMFDGLHKWQVWIILMTVLLMALTIEVWFYWSKSTNCCSEIRGILGCDEARAALPLSLSPPRDRPCPALLVTTYVSIFCYNYSLWTQSAPSFTLFWTPLFTLFFFGPCSNH